MLQNPCKTLGFKKNMVYQILPGGGGGGGGVNHIQAVARRNTFPKQNYLLELLWLIS